MFFPFEIDSLNGLSQLPDGIYEAVCSVFRQRGTTRLLVLTKYRLRGGAECSACDLVVLEGESVLFRDFQRMPDQSWRDSYGRRAAELQELLPPEMMTAELIRREAVGAAYVGEHP